MGARKVSAVGIFWRHIGYGWPVPGYGRRGHLRLRPLQTFGLPAVVDTEPLSRALESGDTSHLRAPRLYHGCASREILERIKRKTGTFLNSQVPDTYFEYYSLFSERNFLFVEHPFSINGHSPASNGGAIRFTPRTREPNRETASLPRLRPIPTKTNSPVAGPLCPWHFLGFWKQSSATGMMF